MSLPSKISSDSQVPQYVAADGTKETKSIVYTQSDLQKIIPVINALIAHLSAGVLGLTTPLLADGDAGVTITSANQTNASATVTIPDIGDAADEFVMKDTTQTLTGKRLTTPKINEDVALTATATQLNKTSIATAVYNLGTPIAADDDRIVTSTNMKNGTYTVAANPDIPRNITVTATAGATADTMGTITIAGTNAADAVISEVITPVAGETVAGTKAFKTVTSVTGAGWVIDAVEGTNDTIKVGVGDKLGLPVALSSESQVKCAWNDATWVAVAAEVAATPTIEESTIDASTAPYNGAHVIRVFVAG